MYKHKIHNDSPVRYLHNSQRGFAVHEVLLLTIPLCLIAMVGASKLAATASARARAQQAASTAAQRVTTAPCPGDSQILLSAVPFVGQIFKKPKAAKSVWVQAVPAVGILLTGDRTRSAEAELPGYHFKGTADGLIPDDPVTGPFRNEATFICNEPEDGDGLRKILSEAYVFGFGIWQARKMFNSSDADSGPISETPKRDKDAESKADGDFDPTDTDSLDKLKKQADEEEAKRKEAEAQKKN